MPTTQIDLKALAAEMAESMEAGRLDEAATLWDQLRQAAPAVEADPTFPVVIALRSGRPHDALHLLNGFAEDQWPELRALCLHALEDPIWESYARAHEDSPDPSVRTAMRKLLQRPAEISE